MKTPTIFSDDQLSLALKKTYQPFGATGWQVPIFSFGGGAVSGEGGGYGFGYISENDATQLIRFAYELGFNVFDSAPIYGFGLSEKRIGKALKAVREKVYLTSKSGITWHANKRVNLSNDPKVTEMMLRQSLKDFNTEYIDLYFIHWPDPQVDIRKPLEVLDQYQQKGVIRKIGLCNTNADDLAKAQEICEISVIQSEYNLFNRKPEEIIFPACKKMQAAFMAWGPLDKGLLTGTYDLKRTYDDADARKSAPWFKKSDAEIKHALVGQMIELWKHEMNFNALSNHELYEKWFAFLMSFYFSQPIHTILLGSKSQTQLRQALHSLKVVAQLEEMQKSWQHFPKKEELLNIAHSFFKKD